MAYVDRAAATRRPGTIVTVAAIHVVIGYGLVVGLAGGAFEEIKDDPLIGIFTPQEIPPPPPPKPEPQPQPDNAAPQTAPDPYIPPRPDTITRDDAPIITATDVLPPRTDTVLIDLPEGPVVQPKPEPKPEPRFNPVAAAPRNDPARWVTTDDYRSVWINRGLVGTARFRLDIAASGAVTGCTITGSTGHPQLDEATCDLVSKRARFKPSKGSDGQAIAGSYSSAVRWELPD